MLNRIRIYLREMFPIRVYLPFALLNFYVLYLSVQLSLGASPPVISLTSLGGLVTVIGFMLLMRIFDEFKDSEVDAGLFADRPYPRGAVLKKDLLVLLSITLALLLALNLPHGYPLPYFAISLAYALLTYRWFFMKKLISRYLLLALLTHQPVSWLINLYVAACAMAGAGIYGFSGRVILLSLVFVIPVLTWELGRKIKAEGSENEYVTYSKIFGPRSAAAITLFFAWLFSGLLIYLSAGFGLSAWHVGAQSLIAALTGYTFMGFIIKPTRKAGRLKKAIEFHSAASILAYLLFFLLKFGLEWSWS